MTAIACESGHAAVVGAIHANGIATITLSRPEALNAADSLMVNAIRRVLAQFVSDPSVKGIVLRGSTPRAFCAGGDVKRLAKAVQEVCMAKHMAVPAVPVADLDQTRSFDGSLHAWLSAC